MSDNVISSYSNDDALDDGVFVDVTPKSVKEHGVWRWIVTSKVKESFSLAAIDEMWNDFVLAMHKKGPRGQVKFPFVTKMNGKELWCFVEGDTPFPEDRPKFIFKIIFPSEY